MESSHLVPQLFLPMQYNPKTGVQVSASTPSPLGNMLESANVDGGDN